MQLLLLTTFLSVHECTLDFIEHDLWPWYEDALQSMAFSKAYIATRKNSVDYVYARKLVIIGQFVQFNEINSQLA